MISKETIDKVYETARLEEVIGDFVQLKRSGANYKGLSPFTDERTPSFMVSPVKQIWKDFSSGKGGNVIAFLMEHEHFTYPEAIKYLAKKYNIEIQETELSTEAKEEANERESMYLVSEFAQQYFHETLISSEEGKAIGLSYFKERGFTDATVKKFKLGYSPDAWDAFTSEAISKGYQLEFLEKTGLTIVKDEKRFDRFKGRVLFPIHSMSGRVLGFGGRILTNDKKAAKYLNSPESDIYHKSKVLYGIYFAKQAIAKEDNCYLVEGYTDVIQFHQTGIENVVASSGTALTPEQIRLISRLTKNITILYDGDAAGLRASLRGVDLILEQGMNVRICTFPEGEDPDSFARKNALEDLLLYLETNTKDFIQFKALLLMRESGNDPIKKAETIRDMVNSIAKIPDRIKREVYLQECSRIMDISEDVLYNTLAQIGKQQLTDANKKFKEEQKAFEVIRNEERQIEKIDVLHHLEKKILEILLLYGNMVADFEDLVLIENDKGELITAPKQLTMKVYEKTFLDLQQDEIEFTNPLFNKVYAELINHYNSVEGFSSDVFLRACDEESAQLVTSILMDEEKYQLHDWDRVHIVVKRKNQQVSQLLTETIYNLRCHLIEKKVETLQQQTHEKTDGNQDLLSEIIDYHQLKKNLSKKLNRVL